jgi:hypothetical protein
LAAIATATVGEGGWVDLAKPIVVRADDAFIVCLQRDRQRSPHVFFPNG